MRKIGGVNMNTIARLTSKPTNEKISKRYCSVYESLRNSIRQMQQIRKGKLEAKTWEEFKQELENEGK